jgi:hypothetical protein
MRNCYTAVSWPLFCRFWLQRAVCHLQPHVRQALYTGNVGHVQYATHPLL